MKVLFLTESYSINSKDTRSNNGGGWIESLIDILIIRPELTEIGIAFLSLDDSSSIKINNITYFPIRRNVYNKVTQIFNRWKFKIEDQNELEILNQIILDYNPDIIHIFGTESMFCNSIFSSKIPSIVHLQGIMIPYSNNYLPYNISKFELSIFNLFDFLRGSSFWHSYKYFEKKAERELNYFKSIKYVMGRTDWDYQITKFLSPDSVYFEINEILRKEFYKSNYCLKNFNDEIVLTSTISNNLNKGLDVVFKTAKILKNSNLSFKWNIVGIEENSTCLKVFKKKYKIKLNEINVKLLGIKNANELVEILKKSSFYVHQSYIENSSNSICEAQLLGLPVLATAVGGTPSLIKNNFDGFLIPVNDPLYTASLISNLINKPVFLNEVSQNAIISARKRHNVNIIVNKVINSYKKILLLENNK